MSADLPACQLFCLQMFSGFYILDRNFYAVLSAQVDLAQRRTFTGFVCSWHWLYVWMWIHLQHEMCLSAPTMLKEACFSPVLECFALSPLSSFLLPLALLMVQHVTVDWETKRTEKWDLTCDVQTQLLIKIILLIYIQRNSSLQSHLLCSKIGKEASHLGIGVIFVVCSGLGWKLLSWVH